MADDADNCVEVMCIQFMGGDRDNGTHIGTLLLHPLGNAVVVGPNREPSAGALLECLHAAECLYAEMTPDMSPQDRTMNAVVRALLWQIADRSGVLDALPEATLQ